MALLRALRATFCPMLTPDDASLFTSLLADAMPSAGPLAGAWPLAEHVVAAMREGGELQPTRPFVAKVCELDALLSARHCVCLLGGTGKTAAWRALAATRSRLGARPGGGGRTAATPLNPKAANPAELFGCLVGGEWRDGLMAKLLRDAARGGMDTDRGGSSGSTKDGGGVIVPLKEGEDNGGATNEAAVATGGVSGLSFAAEWWLILDGPVDASWAESLNTALDGERTLSLVSAERIRLPPHVRFLLETTSLANASPATVARAAILHLDERGVGWKPLFTAWLRRRPAHLDAKAAAALDAAAAAVLPAFRSAAEAHGWAHVPRLCEAGMVSTLCALLEASLTAETALAGSPPELYEAHVAYAAVWALGGALRSEPAADHRARFSEWWRAEVRAPAGLRFPFGGSVFDYRLDSGARWTTWVPDGAPALGLGSSHAAEAVGGVVVGPASAFASLNVPTALTESLGAAAGALVKAGRPVVIVGGAGCGKSTLARLRLRALPDGMASRVVDIHAATDAAAIRAELDAPLERKTTAMRGPPGTRRLVFFLDDVHTCPRDGWGAQPAVEVLRTLMDHGGWHDPASLSWCSVQNVQLLATLEPSSGGIGDRAQRRFGTVGVPFPSVEAMRAIYLPIVSAHLARGGFSAEVCAMAEPLVQASLVLHAEVSSSLLPSGAKVHYGCSLRELAAVAEGLCRSVSPAHDHPLMMARLWMHEACRVYGDRLVSAKDASRFGTHVVRVAKTHFEGLDQAALTAEPLLFTALGPGAPYAEQRDAGGLRAGLEAELGRYNKTHARMELVLFEGAVAHVCRIARVLGLPRGNLVLLGAGGSGRRSLARLAAFAAGLRLVTFGHPPARSTRPQAPADGAWSAARQTWRELHAAVALHGEACVLLIDESAVTDVRVLGDLDRFLSSGRVPGLHSAEEAGALAAAVAPELRAAGLHDGAEACGAHAQQKVWALVHVVLLVDAAALVDVARRRERFLPSLLAHAAVDWFEPWPQSALISIAHEYLAGEALVPAHDEAAADEASMLRDNLAHHAAFVHTSVVARAAAVTTRARVYATPRAFLELLSTYRSLLRSRLAASRSRHETLAARLARLRAAGGAVPELRVQLAEAWQVVDKRRREAAGLLVQVGQESALADEQAEAGAIEEEKVAAVQAEMEAYEAECANDLAAAEPSAARMTDLLDGLDKTSLVELRNMAQPPREVEAALAATLYLLSSRKGGGSLKKVDVSWAAAKKVMGAFDSFLAALRAVEKDAISVEAAEAVRAFTGPPEAPDPKFSASALRLKSRAASQLCDWVVHAIKCHDVFRDVEPKRRLLEEARERLEEANRKLGIVRERATVLEDRKASLQEQLLAATDEKTAAVAFAEATASRLALAERLVARLAPEVERWEAEADALERDAPRLTGDAMAAAAFVAYAGPFAGDDRAALLAEEWVPDLHARAIPASELDWPAEAPPPTLPAGAAVAAAHALAAAAAAPALPAVFPSLPGGRLGVGGTGWAGGADPLRLLGGEIGMARWRAQGLFDDRQALESAAILEVSGRHPLLIDPQRQGARWLKARSAELRCARPANGDWLSVLGACLEQGLPLLLEECGEALPGALQPVLARELRGKGKKLVLCLGGGEIDVACDKDAQTGMPLLRDGGVLPAALSCRLYLQTRLPNPHFGPDVQAHVALLDFSVTEHGLAESLLHAVGSHDRPDLIGRAGALLGEVVAKAAACAQLETKLLDQIGAAEGDILDDPGAVTDIEATKVLALHADGELARLRAVAKGQRAAMDVYRQVGARGAVTFALAHAMRRLNPCYLFEYSTFERVFRQALEDVPAQHAVAKPPPLSRVPTSGAASLDTAGEAEAAAAAVAAEAAAEADARAAGAARVPALVEATGYACFTFVARGLFARHRLLFGAMLALRLRRSAGPPSDGAMLRALVGPPPPAVAPPPPPVDWLQPPAWRRLVALASFLPELLSGLLADVPHAKRWREWYESEAPEREALPHEWKRLAGLETLLILRALRPDRVPAALAVWVRTELGPKYADAVPMDLSAALADAGGRLTGAQGPPQAQQAAVKRGGDKRGCKLAQLGRSGSSAEEFKLEQAAAGPSPLLFLLAPGGADPACAVRALARERLVGGGELDDAAADAALAVTAANGCRKLAVVSLGGGRAQEVAAEAALRSAAKGGGWVLLQNLEMATSWLPTLEASLDAAAPHAELRLFLSVAAGPALPASLLQRCVLLASEPPTGIKSAMLTAYAAYGDQPWEPFAGSPQLPELKAVLFAIAFFHASLCERRRAGPVGWSSGGWGPTGWWEGSATGLPPAYPFGEADLSAAAATASRVLLRTPRDASGGVPWDSLTYLLGEVVYGGHVADAWDRRLVASLLGALLRPELLDGGRLAPKLDAPPNMDHKRYVEYINETMPRDSPQLLSIHPSSQNGIHRAQAAGMLFAIGALLPGAEESSVAGGALDVERVTHERAKTVIDDLLARVPPPLPPTAQLHRRAPLRTASAERAAARAAAEAAAAAAAAALVAKAEEEEDDFGPLLPRLTATVEEDEESEEEGAAKPAVEETKAGTEPEVVPAVVDVLAEPESSDGVALTPCVAVLLQECERMSRLLACMRSSMLELGAALRGEIAISDERQALVHALHTGRVPSSWASLAWPSHRMLGSWVEDLLARYAQLRDWVAEGGGLEAGAFPMVTWLGGLFHPRAVLSALVQQAAHRAGAPIDELRVSAEVTKKAGASDVQGHAAADGEAVYVSGLHLHGARWDMAGSGLDDASGGGGLRVGRTQSHAMPLLLLYAAEDGAHRDGKPVGVDAAHALPEMEGVLATPPDPSGRELYLCPVYRTRSRGDDAYAFAIPLRTRAPPAKWIAAGVALIMDVAALAGGDEGEEGHLG